MVKELNINDIIIRKGTLKEKYNIKEKKFVNNILHYIIKSNNSNEIILSQFAIEKDFISTKQLEEHNNKKNYIKAFKKQIKKILPLKFNN